MNHQTKKRPTPQKSAYSKYVHLPSANNPYSTTLINWYVSTSLSEKQSELEDLLNKHGDKIGLTPDLRYLSDFDEETYRLLKRIDEDYKNGTH